ncbi:hypothetical protein T08_3067 [Trichinella sp. T8]|nr:hypothetical protein T08_3067 [Trichinella sp. T8]
MKKIPPHPPTYPHLVIFPFLNGKSPGCTATGQSDIQNCPNIIRTRCKSLSRSGQQRPVMNFSCGRVHQGFQH